METNNNKIWYFLLFIIFLTSFSLGFFTSKNIEFNSLLRENNFSEEKIVDKIENSLLKKDLDLSLFWQIYNIINNNYYWLDSVDVKETQYWLIKWYVWTLWDKFSEYFTPKENQEFNETLNWDFEWIWAVIQKHELWILIDSLIKGSPWLKGWLLKWDIIIEANWIVLKDMTSSQAVSHIKWPAWTEVDLKILRNWEKDFLYKKIKREKIKIPSVDVKNLEDNEIWYISINIFWDHTSLEFEELLQEYNKNEKIKWIIIDLRDNWWGLLGSSVEILSNFIEKNKVLVTTKFKNSDENHSYKSMNNWEIFNKKIVVLINWNSASASEIMAWALKDYNKAILVWEKSYWKWSVQQPFTLKDWSMLKLTIAKWYTPKDYSIDNNWIKPDVEVLFQKSDYTPEVWKEDNFKFYDRQLETAKKVLKEYIKLDNIWLTVSKFVKTEDKK